jgi:hypothetical protein
MFYKAIFIFCLYNFQIVAQAEPTEKLADWMMTQIMELCELHVRNMLVSQHVLLLFAGDLQYELNEFFYKFC